MAAPETEIEVTPEMIEAGERAWVHTAPAWPDVDGEKLPNILAEVFRSMIRARKAR